jgi:hypothetical protein
VDTFIQVVAASGPIVLAIMGVIVSDVQRIVDVALAKQAERNADNLRARARTHKTRDVGFGATADM